MKIQKFTRPLVYAAAIAACGIAQATPFQNGSFEAASISPGGYATLGAGNTSITGWTVSAGSVDYIGSYWTAAQGSRSIDLAGASLGTISQTFDTVAGIIYDVTFAMAANPDSAVRPRTLTVAAGDESASFNFTTAGTSLANMGWLDYMFQFTADGATTTLSFTSLNQACCWGPALDNVRVAMPEPASVLLVGLSLLGLGLSRRNSHKA